MKTLTSRHFASPPHCLFMCSLAFLDPSSTNWLCVLKSSYLLSPVTKLSGQPFSCAWFNRNYYVQVIIGNRHVNKVTTHPMNCHNCQSPAWGRGLCLRNSDHWLPVVAVASDRVPMDRHSAVRDRRRRNVLQL